MKKRTRILILGIAMMFIMAMSGCGVNHKSPEGVDGAHKELCKRK